VVWLETIYADPKFSEQIIVHDVAGTSLIDQNFGNVIVGYGSDDQEW
jgi:hypothetical protein